VPPFSFSNALRYPVAFLSNAPKGSALEKFVEMTNWNELKVRILQ
jgi:hypothetical protein